MTQPTGADWTTLERVARATRGEESDLRGLVDSEALHGVVVDLGLAPGLAVAADRAGLAPPEAWRRALTGSISTWLLVDEALRHAAAALAGSASEGTGVVWAPVKGYDVATRFYDEREARPTADLDLLIAEADFEAAQRALAAVGWRSLDSDELEARYLREEGYAWQATGPYPIALEVHFRLWGMVPAGLPEAMLERAGEDAALGGAARRLARQDAYLLAAVHAWTKERPRGVLDWWDLARIGHDRIGRRDGGAEEAVASRESLRSDAVIAAASEWDLELPVALSAAVTERLWPAGEGVDREIGRALAERLRPAEERVLARLREAGPDAVSYRDVVLARLRAGRRSRMGWRSVWRRLWPHPRTVARETPPEWSWPRRRLKLMLEAVRGARRA